MKTKAVRRTGGRDRADWRTGGQADGYVVQSQTARPPVRLTAL